MEEVLIAAYLSVEPSEGTTIGVEETLTVQFDNPPEGVKVSAGRAITTANTLKIHGTFDPGDLTLEITWQNGSGGFRSQRRVSLHRRRAGY